jgi:formylglycine-generating enzyme required for sulfatase activity
MTETEQKSMILLERYDLTVSQRALIERGLALAVSLVKKEYICQILKAKFVLIPAGTFMMGSPEDEPGGIEDETLHQVTISKPLYMQTTEVTQWQWKKVMGGNPSYFKDCGDDCPVENISWDDAQAFIRKLNSMEGTDKYRLPTEAEWEYSCRAGSTMAYCFGDDPGRLGEYAWYCDNSGDKTHPVGRKKPNAWGLYDMHGNVYEWVQDGLEYYPAGHVTDPECPPSEDQVSRGGSCNSYDRDCRTAVRGVCRPGCRGGNMGFRLARTKALGEK